MESHNIIGICLTVQSIMLGLISTYYLNEFYKRKDEMWMIKRRGNIVTAYTICAIALLLVVYPFNVLVHSQTITNDKDSTLWMILNVIGECILTPFFYSAVALILARYWLIYYDFRFTDSWLNLKWKECISSSMTVLSEDKWYISHRSTYGNASWIIKKFIKISGFMVFGSFMALSLQISDIINIQLWHEFNVIVFATILSVLIMVVCKWQPTFSDSIYLYKEMKTVAVCWLLLLSMYAICVIIWYFIDSIYIILIISFVGIMANFILTFLSTFWVMQQMSRRRRESSVYDKGELDLYEILRNDVLFDAFMQHLIKEFCMENLLALIEFTQFKKHIIETFNINSEDLIEAGLNLRYEFPADVPLSDIVHARSTSSEHSTSTCEQYGVHIQYKIMAYRLYNKYIKSASKFELNLSHQSRKRLHELMRCYHEWINNDNFQEMEMVKLFDPCLAELVSLLNGSKKRLQISKSYYRLLSESNSHSGLVAKLRKWNSSNLSQIVVDIATSNHENVP